MGERPVSIGMRHARAPNDHVLEAQEKGDQLTRKISTAATGRIEQFKDSTTTIGFDLGGDSATTEF